MSQQSTVLAPIPSPAVIDMMTRVIMSQTDMTEEQIKLALEHSNYDLKRVIREYMRGGLETVMKNDNANIPTSSNQLRFTEIRKFMDKSAEDYYRRQEMTKIYNQVIEKKKATAGATAGATATNPQVDNIQQNTVQTSKL